MLNAIISTDRGKFSDAAAILDKYESQRKTDEDDKEEKKAKTPQDGAAVAACQERLKESKESLALAKKHQQENQAAEKALAHAVRVEKDLAQKHVDENKHHLLPPR